jgi:hypothetical protein
MISSNKKLCYVRIEQEFENLDLYENVTLTCGSICFFFQQIDFFFQYGGTFEINLLDMMKP